MEAAREALHSGRHNWGARGGELEVKMKNGSRVNSPVENIRLGRKTHIHTFSPADQRLILLLLPVPRSLCL